MELIGTPFKGRSGKLRTAKDLYIQKTTSGNKNEEYELFDKEDMGLHCCVDSSDWELDQKSKVKEQRREWCHTFRVVSMPDVHKTIFSTSSIKARSLVLF